MLIEILGGLKIKEQTDFTDESILNRPVLVDFPSQLGLFTFTEFETPVSCSVSVFRI